MAWESLADFFAAYHRCNNRDLIKAVARCARGRHGPALRKAMVPWWPTSTFHRALKQLVMMDDQPRMYGRISLLRVTLDSTRVCNELETWLCEHGYPLPEPPAPQPLQITTLWDIFNATDRYSKADIKGAICIAMYGDYGDNDAWKPALQAEASWRTAASAWEQELIRFMLAETPADPRPQPRTTCMYNQAKRIRAWLRRNSSFRPTEPWRATDGRPKRRYPGNTEKIV